jgi:anti-anti-sigma regulatory factor
MDRARLQTDLGGQVLKIVTSRSPAVYHPGVRLRHRAVETTWQQRERSETVSSGVLVAIVKAAGCLDANHVDSFAHELDRAIAAGASRLLVDLNQAEEVTTAAMNALLAARQRLSGRDGRIAVALSHRLRRRFRLLQLDRRFLLAADRLEAAELLGVTSEGDLNEDRPAPYTQAA